MTVIHNQQEEENHPLLGIDHNRKCSLCAEPLGYPFLYWSNGNELYFCAGCCRPMKDGFAADLIEIAAIADLQKIYGVAFTLVRQRCTAPFRPLNLVRGRRD